MEFRFALCSIRVASVNQNSCADRDLGRLNTGFIGGERKNMNPKHKKPPSRYEEFRSGLDFAVCDPYHCEISRKTVISR